MYSIVSIVKIFSCSLGKILKPIFAFSGDTVCFVWLASSSAGSPSTGTPEWSFLPRKFSGPLGRYLNKRVPFYGLFRGIGVSKAALQFKYSEY